MSNPSQGDWKRLFREVKTLQKRSNHPNIIPLLASYTLETDESGHYVKTLHLLFPLAEMDLADWMRKPQIPFNMVRLSKQERQAYLYRSIYALVSGISYLHREVDGIFTAHHDLKPRNILVVDDRLKIADFGHSHLRPVIEGSTTEGASGLGTYEYQPPEYWNPDGSRAQFRHGRAFDVWAMGCIIVELATLIVHEWQSGMVTKFGNERTKNPNKDRISPGSVQDGSDVSFHNNLIVVKDWVGRLKDCGGSHRLNEVLDIAAGMLAPKPKNRHICGKFKWICTRL
jgi:serine/threonine protein kinase